MRRLTATGLFLAGFAVILLSGCEREKKDIRLARLHYADIVGRLGVSAFLPSGQDVRWSMEIRDHTTRALVGDDVRLMLGDQEIAGRDGVFEFPLSSELRETNPTVLVRRADGTTISYDYKFLGTFNFMLSGACDAEGRWIPAEQVNYRPWPAVDFGPDRVYQEPPVDEERVAHAGRVLREGRALLRELTGVDAPAAALALTRDSGRRSAATDADKRVVMAISEAESRGPAWVGTFVHEWTHSLLRHQRFPYVQDLRYVEDGLADLFGHLAEVRIFRKADTALITLRRNTLQNLHTPEVVDLYKLALDFTPAHDRPVNERLDGGSCTAGSERGYALGLAYWLGLTEGKTTKVRALFDDLKKSMPAGVAEFEAVLGTSGPDPGAFTLDQARTWLATRPAAGSN